MIEQSTIEYLQSQHRPNILEVKEYGKYDSVRVSEAVYNDGERCFEILRVKDTKTTEVKSSRSLIQYIKEELKRRKNKTGKLATLKIGLDGGAFIADENFYQGICNYSRITSQQWNILKNIDGKILNHEEFLLFLLKLSPSCQDFKEVYKNFLKVRKIGESELCSNPVFVNGEAESGYMVKYKLKGGNEVDSTVPDHFEVSVPFIKASKQNYNFRVEVQILNGVGNELRIKVNIPTLENVEEQAVIDEIESIKNDLTEYEDLLILSDI